MFVCQLDQCSAQAFEADQVNLERLNSEDEKGLSPKLQWCLIGCVWRITGYDVFQPVVDLEWFGPWQLLQYLPLISRAPGTTVTKPNRSNHWSISCVFGRVGARSGSAQRLTDSGSGSGRLKSKR